MMILIPVQNEKDYYYLLASEDKLKPYLICLYCHSCVFINWSSYIRNSLPTEQIIIQRMRCSLCKVTHALLPAFLLGKVRYTLETISPYFEQLAERQTTISHIYHHQPDDQPAPKEISTLYRWIKRLTGKCKQLVSQLQQEILKNNPPDKLKKIIKEVNADGNNCQIQDVYRLAAQFIKLTKQYDHQGKLLSPLIFLNYFCWQKTKQPLLGVLNFSPT